jgi:hypothetical protein
MSELAEVMVSRPFAYNEYPSKPVTAIHAPTINGTHTRLALPLREHYFQVAFAPGTTAD